jgi:hypothetical protein
MAACISKRNGKASSIAPATPAHHRTTNQSARLSRTRARPLAGPGCRGDADGLLGVERQESRMAVGLVND